MPLTRKKYNVSEHFGRPKTRTKKTRDETKRDWMKTRSECGNGKQQRREERRAKEGEVRGNEN